MSVYWNLGCRDCGHRLWFHWNHGEDELDKLSSELCNYEFECPSGDWTNHAWRWAENHVSLVDICEFANKHKGHDVLPVNEYGEYLRSEHCGDCS